MSATQQRYCYDCKHDGNPMTGTPCSGCDELGSRWEARADAPAAAQGPAGAPISLRKHPHYFEDVSGLATVDVYRVLELFDVYDPCLQHAVKKLLVAGGRGVKDQGRDVQEAIDTLTRWQEMRAEDQGGN